MKRNLFPFLFVLSFICSSLWAKSPAQGQKERSSQSFHAFTGKICGDRVRVRLHPNLDGHIIQEASKGEIYAVVAERDGYYGIVPSSNMKAYIYRSFVMDNKVDAERVNVRIHPSIEAPVIAQLNSGDFVDGKLASNHPKWYEISYPQGIYFWVAKEYLEEIGPVEYVQKYHERLSEANQLLATAELITQTEFRKEFQEIDIKRLFQNFEKIAKDFPELSDVKEKAQKAVNRLDKEYSERKIAFLEGKAGKAVQEVESLNARLAHQEREDDFPPSEQLNNIQIQQFTMDLPEKITDKMKIWQPLEMSLFQMWSSVHPGASLENYYGEESINAASVTGIIESFNTVVKHKPGDFILTSNGQTVAYLYSTHVNLQDLIGKKVELKVSPRDNHNFAFPAYYVLEVEE